MSVSATDRTERAVLLFVAVSAAITWWLFRGIRHDDAFITLQYARNIAGGAGYVFNEGDPILGTTSPLHALLLAALHRLTGVAPVQLTLVVGSIALSAQAFLLHRLLRDDEPGLALVAPLLVLGGYFGSHAWLALETNVFAALALATLHATQRQAWRWAGVLLGLTFLCRYDGALLVPLVVASSWLRFRRLPTTTLAISFFVVAPWLLFATWYFGSFLPNTLGAKSGVTSFTDYVRHYLDHFGRSALGPLSRVLPESLPAVIASVSALAGAVLLARFRALIELTVFATAHFLVYAGIGPPAPQHWHMYPAQLVFGLLVFLGVFGWLTIAARSIAGAHGAMAARACAALVALAAGASTLSGARALQNSFWLGLRHERYERIASWVNEQVSSTASFMAPEVGTLGYLTQRRMIDPYGLINETNDFPRTHSLGSFFALVDHYQPDLLLMDAPEQAARAERLLGYRVVKIFPWDPPWTTLLVRAPEVLKDPASLEPGPQPRASPPGQP